MRTTDAVRLSWAQAKLAEAGVETVVFDLHASIADGSIGALPRRLMVATEDAARARRALARAEAELEGDGR